MTNIFLFPINQKQNISQELESKRNCSPPTPPFFLRTFLSFFFLFFFSVFFPKSHRLFWILQFISPSFCLKKNTFHQKTWYFFLPKLPANCLALSRQVSRINKLTFRKITKVQVGCLRGESLNIRWSRRLQKVSIKVTVQAAFACPGKVCFYRPRRAGSCIHPGQGGLVPPGRSLHCQGCCCCCHPRSCKQLRRLQCDKFNCHSIKYGKGARSPFCPTQAGMKEPAADLPSQRLHPMLLITPAWGRAGSGPQPSPLLPRILLAYYLLLFFKVVLF